MEKFLHILWVIGLVVAGIVGLIVLIAIIWGLVYLIKRIKFGKEYEDIKPVLKKSQFLANQAILGKPKIAWILPYRDLERKYLPDPIDTLFNPGDNLNVVPNKEEPGSVDFQNYLCVKLVPDYISGTLIGARIQTKPVSDNLFIGISYLSIVFLDENHEYLYESECGQSLREEYEVFLNNELSKCVGSEAEARVKDTALSDFLNSFEPANNCNFLISFDDIDNVTRRKAIYFSCDLEFYVFYGDNADTFSRFKYVGVKHYDDVELSDLYDDYGFDNKFINIDGLGYYNMPYSAYRNHRKDDKKDYISYRMDGHTSCDALMRLKEHNSALMDLYMEHHKL